MLGKTLQSVGRKRIRPQVRVLNVEAKAASPLCRSHHPADRREQAALAFVRAVVFLFRVAVL